jgi:hypothetical protein
MEPEILNDEDGTWCRRDVFVQEMAEYENEPTDKMDEVLQEMIDSDDWPMISKEVGDSEYIQLSSRMAGHRKVLSERFRGLFR